MYIFPSPLMWTLHSGWMLATRRKVAKPDYINLYINYSKNGDMELFVDYCNNSTGDGDIDVAVELTPEQHKAVKSGLRRSSKMLMESALQMPSSRNANWRVESHDEK